MKNGQTLCPAAAAVILVLSVVIGGLVSGPSVLAQEFPAMTGRVVDAANIIPDDQEAALTAKLAALETQSQRQLVVATIPDLQGYDIADYGYQLGRKWAIGDAERNDGALIIVAPNDRKTRIEIGYGLEGIMTDALSSVIISQHMIPRFREGDYGGGIDAAADSIIQHLTLPEDEARAVAAQAAKQPKSGRREAKLDFPSIIFLGLFFFFIILPMLRGARGSKYRGKRSGGGSFVENIILWEVGSAVLRGAVGGGRFDGGGGFGGGGFGGGGFGGGGGSFGGGGASGGW